MTGSEDKVMICPVLSFNTGPYLERVLEALAKHPIEVMVIDNGSDEPQSKYVPKGIRYIRLEKSCGIIHGRNLGFSLRSPGRGVLVLADDILVPPGNWPSIMENTVDLTLAMRPEGDIAFAQYDQTYKIIRGAPTSFQCVYFPSKVLDKIGYADERYIWGDDGLMMRKNPHGVLRDYKIIQNQRLDRGPKYRPLRQFYEELWRPGKLDGPEWDTLPKRYNLQDVDKMILEKCPTIWNMEEEDNPEYYWISTKIKECFEKIWDDPDINRVSLLETLK